MFRVKPELGPIREADLVAGRVDGGSRQRGDASHWFRHETFRIASARVLDHWEINPQLSGRPFDIAGSGD